MELLYTVPEIAKLLKVNPNRVYDLINKGLLIGLKLGRIKVTHNELMRFLNENQGLDLNDLDNIKPLEKIC